MQRGLEGVIIKFEFDLNGRYEYPTLVLADPNFEELYLIEQAKDLTVTPRFNSTSEMEFTIYKRYNNLETPYYEDLLKNKLVHMIGWGWWIIDQVTETYDGGTPTKSIHCFSYEYTINYKGINLLDGTYKFYDLFKPEGTFLHELMKACPNWKIGHIDSELLGLYRTFDIPDGTLYGFLMGEASNTYEAIFDFDTENLVINAYAPKNVVRNTDIMLTFDNVNKNIEIQELSTDVYTVLNVNGADNLSINVVNPLGDNKLYNFSYYKNSRWIKDQALIDKITRWENEVERQRTPYANLLNTLKSQNRDLLKLQTELRDLQSELNAIEIVRKNQVGVDGLEEELKKNTDRADAKTLEINAKKKEIEAKESQVSKTKDGLTEINNSVRFDKYFTDSERLALDPYIIESVYTDENFIVTDQMRTPADANGETLVITTTGTKKIKDLTLEDILIDEQYIANQLLEQGREVLSRISQPSFTFSLDTTNFLFQEKFLPFIKQIQLGCMINIEIQENDWAYPVLLEMTINYDNPTDFSMVFGNRFRLSDAEWTFAELHNETAKVSTQVGSTLGVIAEPVLNGSINSMSQYMANNLIAANQEIQSTKDNEVSFGGYGIRLRKLDPENVYGYDPHQTWMSNNLICMTDDNWQTTKLAIGALRFPEQEPDPDDPNPKPEDKYYYGINAEILAGKMLIGNELIIQDGAGDKPVTFVVDGKGARLTNASFTLTTKEDTGKITLNPEQGIFIETKRPRDDGTNEYKKVFYVDTNGSLIAEDITTKSGTIGGFLISEHQIRSTNNNIILSDDGSGKIALMTWGPADAAHENKPWADFKGNIYAENLDPKGFSSTVINNKFDMDEYKGWPASDMAGKVKDWDAEVLRVSKLYADDIYAETIKAVNVVAGRIEADVASFKELVADSLEAQNVKIDNLVAKAITTDNMSAIKISASQITSGTISSERIDVTSLTSNVIQSLNGATLGTTSISTLTVANNLYVGTNQDRGRSGTYYYTDSYGDRAYFKFLNGVLIGYGSL